MYILYLGKFLDICDKVGIFLNNVQKLCAVFSLHENTYNIVSAFQRLPNFSNNAYLV